MKRVFVTGATGGLGRNAVDALLAQGMQVRASGRNTAIGAKLAAQGAEFIAADLAHATPSGLRDLVAGCDTVWHCAALSSPWGPQEAFELANVTVSRNLARAANAMDVQRFVHISTPALYFDFQDRYSITEDFKPSRYVNHYAETKARAEQEVLSIAADGLHVTILRPRAIFGPYDQVLLPRLLRLLDQKDGSLILPRAGKTVLDMTYASNVVHAMRLASTRPDLESGEIFNITNDEPLQVGQVLEALFVRELGRPMQLRSLPYPFLAGIARSMEAVAHVTGKEPAMTRYSLGALAYDMTLDISRARGLLGYVPQVNMHEAVLRTAKWLRRNA